MEELVVTSSFFETTQPIPHRCDHLRNIVAISVEGSPFMMQIDVLAISYQAHPNSASVRDPRQILSL